MSTKKLSTYFNQIINFNPITGKVNDNLSVLTGRNYSCINEQSNTIFIDSIITSNIEYPILNTNNSRILIISSLLNNPSACINMYNSRSTILPLNKDTITQNQDNSFNNIINPHEGYVLNDNVIPTLYNDGNYLYWSNQYRTSLNKPIIETFNESNYTNLSSRCLDLQGQTIQIMLTGNNTQIELDFNNYYNCYFHIIAENNSINGLTIFNSRCKTIIQNITFKKLKIKNCLNVKLINCKFNQTSLNISSNIRTFSSYNQLTLCQDVNENLSAALYVEHSKVFVSNTNNNRTYFFNCNFGVVANKGSIVCFKNNLYIKQFLIRSNSTMQIVNRPIALLAVNGSYIFTGENKFYTHIIYNRTQKLHTIENPDYKLKEVRDFNYYIDETQNIDQNNSDEYNQILFTQSINLDLSKIKYREKDLPFVLMRHDYTSSINHNHQFYNQISALISGGVYDNMTLLKGSYEDKSSIPTGSIYAYYGSKQTANGIITGLLPQLNNKETSGIFTDYNDVYNNAKPIVNAFKLATPNLSSTQATISSQTGHTIITGSFKLL